MDDTTKTPEQLEAERLAAEKAAADEAAKSSKTKSVRARVLVDGRFGAVNAVVTVNAAELKAAAGELDADKDAVAYADSLASGG